MEQLVAICACDGGDDKFSGLFYMMFLKVVSGKKRGTFSSPRSSDPAAFL